MMVLYGQRMMRESVLTEYVKNGVKPNHVPIHYQETDGVHTGQNSAEYA